MIDNNMWQQLKQLILDTMSKLDGILVFDLTTSDGSPIRLSFLQLLVSAFVFKIIWDGLTSLYHADDV